MASFIALTLTLAASSAPQSSDVLEVEPLKGLAMRRTFGHTYRSERASKASSSISEGRSVLVVLDTYLGVTDGRVTSLRRTFDDVLISNTIIFKNALLPIEDVDEHGSELEGATVLFEWDEDHSGWKISSDDAVPEAIEDLRCDLDFAEFLPRREVQKGDAWTVDAEAFTRTVHFMKGVPIWIPSEDDGDEGQDETLGVVLEHSEQAAFRDDPSVSESIAGELKFTYSGQRAAEGTRLGIVKIKGEIEVERSSDRVRETGRSSLSWHTEHHESRTLEGELLWDIEHGHLHSLEVRIKIAGKTTTETVTSFDGRELDTFTSTTEDSGSETLTVAFERV